MSMVAFHTRRAVEVHGEGARLLAVDGSFYTLLQSVKLEDGRDDPSTTYYLTELVDPAGRM